MNYVNQYYWFASQAFGGLTYFWPVTLCILVAIPVTAIKYFRVEKVRFSFRYLFIFTPLLLIIANLSIGVFLPFSYVNNQGASKPPSWPSSLIMILFWVQILLGSIIGYKLREIRWLAVAIIVLQVWYALHCSFLATMSVIGNWI